MAVLVTGGAGYIGSHMVLALLDRDEEVVVLDNLSTGFDWVLPPEVKLVIGDMGDQELVADVIRRHGIEAIAHFAAKIVVPDSVADPLGYYLNNTVKSRALIESAVRRAGAGGPAAQPDQSVWPLEADDRVDAAGRRPRARPALRGAALFQRRRGRSARALRPVDPERHASDQGRGADGARRPLAHRGLRRRLSDPGRL